PRPERPREATKPSYDPHSVLVRFKSGASAAAKDRALTSRGARNAGAVTGTGFIKARTTGAATDLLRGLRKDPAVQSLSLDYRRRTTATPNDPEYTGGKQDYLKTVRLPQAWDRTKGSTSQVIAVVDTGVNGLHPDIKGRTVTGYNAITNVVTAAGAVTDDSTFGHGTMVAGIAAANTSNGIGVAGVAWVGRVMPVKVLDSSGSGYDSDIAEGITWAADHGAKIINLSLGGPGDSPALHSAISYAVGRGAVVVAAAGNTGDGTPLYPAAYPEALAVGATDAAGNLTDFSSWGDWIDVAAPGFGIVSTGRGQDYFIGDGTSFSAPIVSGVAALARTMYPTLTPAQVMGRLRFTARDAGPRGIDPYYGYGLLDAFYAVGGGWGAEFPQRPLGTFEPNDVPARATTLSSSIVGTIAMEGDVDWYRYESDGQQSVEFRVTPAAYDVNRAQNFDPILAVYDKDLRLLGEVDNYVPGVAETLSLTLDAGTHYVAVRNYNGAADTRSYTLTVGVSSAAPSPAGEQVWVRDVSPADFATGLGLGTAATVTFARAVDPASVSAATVRLVNGRSGAAVPATLGYDAGTATLTPVAALQDNTPYRIVVAGLRDGTGAEQVGRFSTTFRTVDVAPPAVGNLKATGGQGSATLSWTVPAITDLDQVIVRMAAGTTPPSSPTAGTGVYAGTGPGVTVSGLAFGTTYTFRVWVRDRPGRYSGTAPSVLLVGTRATISGNTTAVTYGGAVTVTGRLVRADTGAAIAGAPVQLLARHKGTTNWLLLGTPTSSSTGYLTFSHTPSWSLDYVWVYRGSTVFMGTGSPGRAVGVRPVVSATLSRTSFALGGSATLSGSVAPGHAGHRVYLQRLANGAWVTASSQLLPSTSTYAFTIKPGARGTFYYRVYKPADTDHLAALSATRSMRVY
ncbi:MAG TPA: S8 family serine peptidase, partial [Micromonosporaceae bacterium]|nr:S8 family serine peptidase [Micromonosporaceae bacterium]